MPPVENNNQFIQRHLCWIHILDMLPTFFGHPVVGSMLHIVGTGDQQYSIVTGSTLRL